MSLDHHLKFGYHFHPSQDEIVETLSEFVDGKINIDELWRRSIIVGNVYECRPWELDWSPKEGLDANVRYFFVHRKKASRKPHEMRACRRIGDGDLHWKNRGASELICGGKAIISKLKLITQEEQGCSSSACRTIWLLQEYILNRDKFQDFSICKIKRQVEENTKRNTEMEESACNTAGPNMQGQDHSDEHDQVISDQMMNVDHAEDQSIFNDLLPFLELDDRFGAQQW